MPTQKIFMKVITSWQTSMQDVHTRGVRKQLFFFKSAPTAFYFIQLRHTLWVTQRQAPVKFAEYADVDLSVNNAIY